MKRSQSPKHQVALVGGLLVALCGLVHVLLAWVLAPELWDGVLYDPDSHVRLARVEALLEGQSWYDGSIRRSNPPFGHPIQWTRPLDAVLVFLSWLVPAEDSRVALFWAGVWVSPLLHLAALAAAVWAWAPILSPSARPAVVLGMLAQPMISSFGLAGTADHHMLQIFLFVLSTGFLVRATRQGSSKWSAQRAGFVTALGIWVSVESLLPLLAHQAGLAILWLRAGARHDVRIGIRYSGALAVGLLCVLVLERPLSQLVTLDDERISLLHVGIAGLATCGWLLLMPFTAKLRSLQLRVVFGLLVAGGLAGLMALTVPGFFAGPWSDVSAEMSDLYVRHIPELAPIWPVDAIGVGAFIAYMGPVLVALCALLLRMRTKPLPPAWLLVAVGIAAMAPFAFKYARMIIYAQVLAVPALVHIAFGSRHAETSSIRERLELGLRGAAVLAGPLLAGAVLVALVPAAPASPDQSLPDCDVPAISRFLDEVLPGADTLTILATPKTSVQLLYYTQHRVLTIGFHNKEDGLPDVHRAFSTNDPVTSREVLTSRAVDLVLICPRRDAGFYRQSVGTTESLYSGIVAGNTPAWLEPLELPDSISIGALLFRYLE